MGYANQKFFILLLFYASAACLVSILINVLSIWENAAFKTWIETLRLVLVPLCIVTFFILKSFLSEQIEYLESNITLIETFKNCLNGESEVLTQLFGQNPFLWSIPISSSLPPDYTENVINRSVLSSEDAQDLGVDITELEQVDSDRPVCKKLD